MKGITVDGSNPDERPKTPKIYAMAGFSPAALGLTAVMHETIAAVGNLRGNPVEYVRILSPLDLVRPIVGSITSIAPVDEQPLKGKGLLAASRHAHRERPPSERYIWDSLDQLIDTLLHYNLKPFLNLMGNPGSTFTSFNDQGQIRTWCELINGLAVHLIERFGQAQVRSWYFESWNEPASGWWGQIAQPSISDYLAYYDACSEGLRRADPALRFGGPATAETHSAILASLLAHCREGHNAISGERGVRLDFISVHEKGMGSRSEDVDIHPESMLKRELRIRSHIAERWPEFADLPFVNSEADPQVGWTVPHTWRATARYPTHMARILLDRISKGQRGAPWTFVNNDNLFPGTWGERTLFTVWTEGYSNDYRTRRGSSGPVAGRTGYDMVPKPAYAYLSLLGRLQSQLLACRRLESDDGVGYIVTSNDEGTHFALLFFNWMNTHEPAGGARNIPYTIKGVPGGTWRVTTSSVNENRGNAFALWNRSGAPRKPLPALRRKMSEASAALTEGKYRDVKAERRTLSGKVRVAPGSVSVVTLIHSGKKAADKESIPVAGPAELLRSRTPEGIYRATLVWREPDYEGLAGYEVLVKSPEAKKAKRVSPKEWPYPWFTIDPEYLESGATFSVCCRDIWGTLGNASQEVEW